MDEASVDRYEFIRNAYFQQRNYLIHDGNPPMDEEFEKDIELEGLKDNLDDSKTELTSVSQSSAEMSH